MNAPVIRRYAVSLERPAPNQTVCCPHCQRDFELVRQPSAVALTETLEHTLRREIDELSSAIRQRCPWLTPEAGRAQAMSTLALLDSYREPIFHLAAKEAICLNNLV